MGTTPNYVWPYPELTDPPDGAGQIKALANAVDTTTKGIDNRVTGLAAPPLTVVRQTVDQNSIPSSSFTLMICDSEDIDTSNMHSTTSNKDRLTCTVPGWYECTGGASLFGGAQTTRRVLYWYLNGARINPQPGQLTWSATSGQYTDVSATVLTINLAIGDYIGLAAYHDGGAGVDWREGFIAARFIRA